MGAPQNHPFLDGIFHYKPSILGVPPIYGNPHVEMMEILVGMQRWTTSASFKDDPTMPCGVFFLESAPLCMNTASVAARSPYEGHSKNTGIEWLSTGLLWISRVFKLLDSPSCSSNHAHPFPFSHCHCKKHEKKKTSPASNSSTFKPRKLLICSTKVAWVVDRIKAPSTAQTRLTKLLNSPAEWVHNPLVFTPK